MPLGDYSYMATLGQTCGPCFQLQRAILQYRLSPERGAGPFDWSFVTLAQAAEILGRDFQGYFAPETLSSVVLELNCWRVTDRSGASVWHQMKANPGEAAPSVGTWFSFGMWLGARLQSWRRQLRDPAGNVLFIRNESPFVPDEPEDMHRLVSVLKQQSAGRWTLLWLRYDDEGSFDDPNVRVFRIRRPWPGELEESRVDYERDYGHGVAWRGRDDDWKRVWEAL